MGRTIGRTLKQAAAGLAVLLTLSVIALAVQEAWRTRRLTSQHGPPGDMVSIGTHRLHLFCQGSGTPPVLLDAGSGLAFMNWSAVQTGLTGITTVCSYDRSGLGWSDAGPVKPSAHQATAELHALLEASGIPGPWVVVGHSLGGLYAQQFLIPQSARQVADSRTSWGDTPLIVMQAGSTNYPEDWPDSDVAAIDTYVTASQRALASRSTRGRYMLVEESGHGIPWEHPEAVIDAVSLLVRERR